MQLWSVLGATLVAVGGIGCGHVTQIRPTPVHQLAIEGALGGPLGKVENIPIELPLATVGASYGIAERFDVEAHAHLTTLVFGVAGLDVGGSWLVVEERGWVPAVNLNGKLYGFSDFRSARGYLELTPSVSYLFRQHFLTYVSGTAWVQAAGGPVLLTLAAGEEFQLGRWGLQLELRWYEPNYNSMNLPPVWAGLGGFGAWGALIGARYRFGGDT